ncbi:thiaminase II [uncultured Clostridium sp.]|uniref:thiaminase II n=1 Tax=uncultured Clostridium sp. TaxID=59620 RepID=UPI0026157865|nr:thiaminase II [uncultured Clostridium sp.]
MKFTDKLYSEVKEIWNGYLEHPFILGMKDGTLDKELFRDYLVQDYLYLKEYAKVFCMGIIKSKDMEEMRFLYKSISGTMEEGASHIRYMEELGITEKEAESMKAENENVNYTNYMINVSLQGDIKEIAIATLVCSWSYGFIGEHLLEEAKLEGNYYKEWIALYGDGSYKEFMHSWLKYINDICKNISKKEERRYIEIFKQCSLYELEFWDMSLRKNKVGALV